MDNTGYDFSWKVQGGNIQTSITLLFRKPTTNPKTRSKATRKRDIERVKQFHVSETQTQTEDTWMTQTQNELTTCESAQTCENETQTKDELTTCEKGVQSCPNERIAEKQRQKLEQEKEKENDKDKPYVELEESPESAEGTSKSKILISGQDVLVYQQIGNRDKQWTNIGGEAVMYMCRDKKYKEKKWLLVKDKENKRTIANSFLSKNRLTRFLQNTPELKPVYRGLKPRSCHHISSTKNTTTPDSEILSTEQPIHRENRNNSVNRNSSY